jgi:tetratricopeptide (TPR) repeat protein
MRATRYGVSVLVLAALAVGCSKHEETSRAQPKSLKSEPSTPPTTSTEPTTPKSVDTGQAAVPQPAHDPASFADGEAVYRAKKYAEATSIFEAYVERHPKNAMGHYMVGLSAWKSGDFAKSEKAFEDALKIEPQHVKSLINLSRVLLDQKRFDEAISRLTIAIEINPESAEVCRLLGRGYSGKGSVDQAVEAYNEAISLNDQDVWSMNNLALLFLETQRAEDALPLLVKATALRNDVPEFHNNLGMALEHTGRFKAAATAYSDALSADSSYHKAKQNLARVEAMKTGPEAPVTVEETVQVGADKAKTPRQ